MCRDPFAHVAAVKTEEVPTRNGIRSVRPSLGHITLHAAGMILRRYRKHSFSTETSIEDCFECFFVTENALHLPPSFCIVALGKKSEKSLHETNPSQPSTATDSPERTFKRQLAIKLCIRVFIFTCQSRKSLLSFYVRKSVIKR